MGPRCHAFKRVARRSEGSPGIALNASHKATDSLFTQIIIKIKWVNTQTFNQPVSPPGARCSGKDAIHKYPHAHKSYQ